MDHPRASSSTLLIAASWILVLIPLGWGVVQSVVKSLPLFERQSTQATAAPARR